MNSVLLRWWSRCWWSRKYTCHLSSFWHKHVSNSKLLNTPVSLVPEGYRTNIRTYSLTFAEVNFGLQFLLSLRQLRVLSTQSGDSKAWKSSTWEKNTTKIVDTGIFIIEMCNRVIFRLENYVNGKIFVYAIFTFHCNVSFVYRKSHFLDSRCTIFVCIVMAP